jgi:GxxExxY protein
MKPQRAQSPTEFLSINDLTERAIGAAMKVHSKLGPGLLESAYQACLFHELISSGIRVEKEVPLPIIYEGVRLDCGYKIDLL